MTKLEELEKLHKSADTLDVQLNFIALLLDENSLEIINYHYLLLKDKEDTRFFQMIRSNFKKRGEKGVNYLIKKLTSESDIVLKAEALFVLGSMDKLEADQVSQIKESAKNFICEKYDYTTQYYGIIVLYWVGLALRKNSLF